MPTKSAGNAIAHIQPAPDHDIDLSGGQFHDTNPEQLTQAFAQFLQSGTSHLCVFFHGGLVGQQDGLKTAHALMKSFTDAGAYPFFFIWNSDLLTTLGELLKPHQEDPQFVTAANRGFAIVARKMAAALGQESLTQRAKVRAPRGGAKSLKALSGEARPYDRAWARQDGAQLSISHKEMDEFVASIVAVPSALPREQGFVTGKLRGRHNPLWRIIHRFNTGHDHGLYTTLVEELLIAAQFGGVGETIWGQMKKDVDSAFAFDASAGGSAFLDHLLSAWATNPNLRVTLIGHSAGAIYVQRFLEALDARAPNDRSRQVEVVTLAAALSFDRLNQRFDVWEKRVKALRVFGLSNPVEINYWEVPFVYDKSLLYLVSSLCEADPDADKPLLGMQRYWSGEPPYDQPALERVIDFIVSTRSVWSLTPDDAKCGYRTQAIRHGGFPVDPETMESMAYILKQGFTTA